MGVTSANQKSSVAGTLPFSATGSITVGDKRQVAGLFRFKEGSVWFRPVGKVRSLINPKNRIISLALQKE